MKTFHRMMILLGGVAFISGASHIDPSMTLNKISSDVWVSIVMGSIMILSSLASLDRT